MNRIRLLLPLAVLMLCLLTLSPAPVDGQERQQQTKDAAILMSGQWQGTWISYSPESSGYVYFADLQLKVDGNNAVEGKITWTLKKTPPGSLLAGKIGQTAVEHVKGTYNPVSKMLIVDGHKKDDPREIIALDKYRLILAENNKVLGGITSSGETWHGLISLSVKKADK